MSKELIKKEVLYELTRISGDVSSVSEFQYNKTDVKFAISRAISKTAQAILDETLGVIEREYVDYDPHHRGYSINKIDFNLLKEHVKKHWVNEESDVK